PKGEKGPKGDAGPRGARGPAGADGQGFRWRGRWSPGLYAARDVVEHLGSSYVATRETRDVPGRSGSGWELMAQRGFDGIGGGGGGEVPRDLDVDSVSFPDGSSLSSAPEPPDLTPYATKAGTETLENKTLSAP